MKPIVRHIKTNIPYEYQGGNKFKNMVTGQEGEVTDEQAKEVFRINVEASLLAHNFPLIKEAIHKIKLKFDKS